VSGSISPTGATLPDLQRELETVVQLARQAGEIVKTFYQVPPTVRWKEPTEPVTEADRAANAFLVKQIGQAFPDDGILAEESKDDLTRLNKSRVWMVDPLDGTMEFIARNGEFCIMVGLVIDGYPVVGAVYQPMDDVLYVAASGLGAYVEEFGERRPLHVSPAAELSKLRPVVSRSHRPPILDTLLEGLGTQRAKVVGSAGLKMAMIARGQAEFYLHPSAGTKQWDTCAPEVVLREAGGVVTDCWDRPLRYNQRDVRQCYGLLATNAAAHEPLAQSIDHLLDEAGLDADFGF
jgi:3'(2'), 5'-bisphosphate nucleotidase